ncbi:MAG: multicopper oxidase family protein [Limisphaerales bacterium]
MVPGLAALFLTISTIAGPLPDLRSISSTNGLLRADLVITNIDTFINGHHTHGLRTYNGEFPGPTLHAHPGDTMSIRYINRLEVDTAHAAAGHHGQAYNSVNLHTHGLNISPEGYSDNVYLEILPGQWVPFEFHIPTNHPTGLFWYHPHRHGGVSTQMGSGLAGNIILSGKGDLSEIPEVAAAKTVEMIFNEIPLTLIPNADPNDLTEHFKVPDDPADFRTPGVFDTNAPRSLRIYTLNGAPLLELDSLKPAPTPLTNSIPEWALRPGEVQRWMITHAGLDQFLNLALVDDAGVPQPIYILSFDGITVPVLQPNTNGILLGGGNRVEVLVQAPPLQAGATGAVYHLKSLPNTDQFGSVEIPLATLTVGGAITNMALPVDLNPPIARLPHITDQEIVRYRKITFDFNSDTFSLTVNGVPFDPLSSMETMLLDTAEEWNLSTVGISSGGGITGTNSLPLAHPFHIHVNWFQVVKINGQAVPPRWQDTVVIPFGGNVTIRHRFQQYTGRYVLHCHILPHEDLGMMAGVEVVDPRNLNALQAWRLENLGSFENFGDAADDTAFFDPLQNLFHYAYGLAPFSTDGLPAWQKVRATGEDYIGFQFNWRVPPAGVSNPANYVLFESTNLTSWLPVASTVVGTPVDKGNGLQSLVVRDTKPIGTPGPERFLMMTVQTQPVALPITPDLP